MDDQQLIDDWLKINLRNLMVIQRRLIVKGTLPIEFVICGGLKCEYVRKEDCFWIQFGYDNWLQVKL